MRRLLREIGRGVGKSDYDWLHGRLVALTSCGIVIEDVLAREGTTGKKRVYTGALLFGATDDTSDEAAFTLNPYLRGLFGPSDYTALDWDGRLELRGKQFAKWLHAFYSTHADPYPMKVATLKDLCGSEIVDLKKFRQSLKGALDDLKCRRLIRAWSIDDADLVRVTIIPSASQARRLGQGTG